MSARLAGRSALITGATDGIGAAIAQALAVEGAHVIVSGRNAARGARVVESIAGAGGRADFVPADLGTADGPHDLAREATKMAGGRLHILVNNAAMLIPPMPTAEVPAQLVQDAFDVNVRGALLLTGRVAPAMADAGAGAIVNLGSILGELGQGGSALYSANKAAIGALTRSWAAEYGPTGVRVNAVAPGPTLTEKVAALGDRIAPIVAAMPSRRANATADVAAAVVFLASDDASNIHGITLPVDGGRSAV